MSPGREELPIREVSPTRNIPKVEALGFRQLSETRRESESTQTEETEHESSFNSTSALVGSYSSAEERPRSAISSVEFRQASKRKGNFRSAECRNGSTEGSSEGDTVDEVDSCSDVGIANLSDELRNRLFNVDTCDATTQTSRDPIASETEKLAFDVIFHVLGQKPPPAQSQSTDQTGRCDPSVLASLFGPSDPSDEVTLCLRRSVDKMLEKHHLVFNSMVARLKVTRESDLYRGFHELSSELFLNGEVSWSKIIALFAFASRLAQYCSENDSGNMVIKVANILAQFAVERLTPFLREHGGWATLCEAFPQDSDYESTIWKSLVFTGLGLTAFATLLAMHSK